MNFQTDFKLYTNREERLVFSAIFVVIRLMTNLTTKIKDNDIV